MASQDHHHHDHSHEDAKTTSWVGADGKVYHSHDGLAPHSHEPIYSPGYFTRRAPPLINRNFNERAFTIGIGGPVGTGPLADFELTSASVRSSFRRSRGREMLCDFFAAKMTRL
uniref:Urease accessory protein G-like n=1 Tax=Nicotiana tabacum TaxID=4097 RepID=A0A1S3ZIU1_TOBAC|nr:PREDICTED: urease accessory protein G-like [Nicotiana tabacum]